MDNSHGRTGYAYFLIFTVMTQILFLEEVHEVLEQRLNAAGYDCVKDYECSAVDLTKRYGTISGMVLRSRLILSHEILSALPQLKWIARSGSGLENIDLTAAKELNIAVFSSPEGNCDAVGEHVIGMLLTLMNRLHLANLEVKSGYWHREANRGHELNGKTIGIIGYGHMGSSLARKLLGFDMRILAFDKYKTIEKTEPAIQVGMEEIFRDADIVSLHLPLSDETIGFANDDFFARFRKSIYFVNTARGKHLKTSSLQHALDAGKVLGACLDVLEFESRTLESMQDESEVFAQIKADQRVLLTPHVAGWTHESYFKLSQVLADKIINTFGDNQRL